MTEYNDETAASKSARKRDMDSLQQTGEMLMSLSPAQLARIPLTPELDKAMAESRRISSHEARRRHAQYVGKLMRQTDGEAIVQAVASLTDPKRQQRLADWMERLVQNPQPGASDALIQEVLEWYPHGDRQHLRNLVRNLVNTLGSADENTPPGEQQRRAHRRVFDYLNTLEKQSPLI